MFIYRVLVQNVKVSSFKPTKGVSASYLPTVKKKKKFDSKSAFLNCFCPVPERKAWCLVCVLVSYRKARLAKSLRTGRPWLPLNADISLWSVRQWDECMNRVRHRWIICSHDFTFQNNTVADFTLGPRRPIPVSPWIPGGPGSPLSPYKNAGRDRHVQIQTQMYKHSALLVWVQGLVLLWLDISNAVFKWPNLVKKIPFCLV